MGFKPIDYGNSDLNMNDMESLYTKIGHLDKLEKLIWVSSMGNKTNKTEFVDILWCQRYGTDKLGKGPCRGANPLSCSLCSIREHCVGYSTISNQMVIVSDDENIVETQMIQNSHLFGIHTHAGTPRKVLVLVKKPDERDAHTGFEVSTNVTIPSSTYEVSEIISVIDP
jgi:hypothetical protein